MNVFNVFKTLFKISIRKNLQYISIINTNKNLLKFCTILKLEDFIENFIMINNKIIIKFNINKTFKVKCFDFFDMRIKKNYLKYKHLSNLHNKHGLLVLNTDGGLISLKEAFKLKKGGSLFCYIN